MMQKLDFILAIFIIKAYSRWCLGYSLNLKNPQSYCEKIQWLKLNDHLNDDKVIARADKYAVRKFIEEKGLTEHLVTLYGCYERPEDIDWEKLPHQFVLKLNNGSGPDYRWFVKNKATFNVSRFEAEARKTMFKKYGYILGEFHYGKIPPKIIAEEYLIDQHHTFKDYKFYCFHGKVEFLSVEEGKTEGHNVIEYYDTKWEKYPVNFFNDYPRPESSFNRPDNLKHMVLIAETLSQGYPHIRVDLYNVNGHIFIGELTYTPESGFVEWKPRSLDFKYGRLMDLRNIDH